MPAKHRRARRHKTRTAHRDRRSPLCHPKTNVLKLPFVVRVRVGTPRKLVVSNTVFFFFSLMSHLKYGLSEYFHTNHVRVRVSILFLKPQRRVFNAVSARALRTGVMVIIKGQTIRVNVFNLQGVRGPNFVSKRYFKQKKKRTLHTNHYTV